MVTLSRRLKKLLWALDAAGPATQFTLMDLIGEPHDPGDPHRYHSVYRSLETLVARGLATKHKRRALKETTYGPTPAGRAAAGEVRAWLAGLAAQVAEFRALEGRLARAGRGRGRGEGGRQEDHGTIPPENPS